jgi:hypothetical protein
MKYKFGFLTRTLLGKARATETFREHENRSSIRTEIWGNLGRTYKNTVLCSVPPRGLVGWMSILPSSSWKRSFPTKFWYLLTYSSLYQSTDCDACFQWERRNDFTQMNRNFGLNCYAVVCIDNSKEGTHPVHASYNLDPNACLPYT